MKFITKIMLLAVGTCLLGIVLSVRISIPVKAASVAVPFHAVIHGNAHPFPINACTLGNHETGSGHALHVGEFTWTSDETVPFLSCPPPTTAIAVSGHFTIVAANGDELPGEYQTTGTFDPVNGVSVRGGYSFVSGTGRFSNVVGSGAIAATGAAGPPFDFVGSMDGTINYAGGQ